MYKKVLFIALAVPLLVLPGCVREKDVTDVQGPMMTIRASLPEEPLTKAGFSVPEEGTGLHLAWQEGDCIRVISGDVLTGETVGPDGFLGFVQGTGKDPSAGQPLSYTKVPDFEDYGTGCFLLGGVEYYKLVK